MNNISFITRISRQGEMLLIIIPSNYHRVVEHGKPYEITLKRVEELGGNANGNFPRGKK